ncbi:flavin reductase like domain-containing protein [Dipodascopsis uninucleata]
MGLSSRSVRSIHTKDKARLSDLISKYKQLMAFHPSALSIISSRHENISKAVTVSSFSSLSVVSDKAPLVSFNLKLPSSTAEVIRQSGRFSVNLLSGVHGAEGIAREFAGSDASRSLGSEDKEGLPINWFPLSPQPYNTPMFNRTSLRQASSPAPSSQLAPLEENNEIAFARLDCKVQECFRVRDHEIWIGEVERVDVESIDKLSTFPSMVYHNRRFKALAEAKVAIQDKQKEVSQLLLRHNQK